MKSHDRTKTIVETKVRKTGKDRKLQQKSLLRMRLPEGFDVQSRPRLSDRSFNIYGIIHKIDN
jgi:hypothetical protein